MKHARLAVFDDEQLTFDELHETLAGTPHTIEAAAMTRQESLDILDKIYAGQLAVDAVLLDGKMDSGDFSDAVAIEQRARRLFGRSLPILGYSMDEMAGRIVPIPRQYDLTKMGRPRLVRLLDEMPETELERLGQ